MTAIRLLITEPTQQRWHALEQQLCNDPGVELVGRVAKRIELLLAIRATGTNVVLFFAEGDDERGILSHLFTEYPDLTVLTLCSSGEAFIEERCPTRWSLAVDSPAIGIVEALHNAVTQPCAAPTPPDEPRSHEMH